MRSRCRTATLAASILLVSAAALEAQAPWKTVEEAVRDYAVITQRSAARLWDLDAETFVEGTKTGRNVLLFPERLDVYLNGGPSDGLRRPPGAFGMAGRGSPEFFGRRHPYVTLRLKSCSVCAEQDVEVSANRGAGPYLSRDRGRIIYFVAGDLWTADVDWMAGTVVHARQVTQVGLLGEGNVMHWYGDKVFLAPGLSRDKPIVQVDLSSGELTEMGTMNVWVGGMFENPTGRYVCNNLSELLVCYDVEEGTTFRISQAQALASARKAGGMPGPNRLPTGYFFGPPTSRNAPIHTVWIDETTALGWPVGSAFSVVLLDLESRSVRTVYIAENASLGGSGIVVIRDTDGTPTGYFEMEFPDGNGLRVAMEDGSAVELPKVSAGGFAGRRWLDGHRLVYAREQGGLSEIGTWLADLDAGSSTRLCQAPAWITRSADGTIGNDLFHSDTRGIVLFGSQAQGGSIFKAALDGSGCSRVTEGSSASSLMVARPGSLSPLVLKSAGEQ